MTTAFVSVILAVLVSLDAQQAAPLRIVVLSGEGGVNIIQQQTAVRPLVEVRDRNNLPVAGATVTFSIAGGGQGAFAGGVQTLTVTTNAAGQAAASSLNALSSGAFQIQVQAAYQGQIATAAISQTNFATAAAAAEAGAGAGGGGTASGATGGAAGGGSGGAATTLGIVGAVVGGGALAATQILGAAAAEAPAVVGGAGDRLDTYNGPLSGQMVFTNLSTNPQGQTSTCFRTFAVVGSMTIQLNQSGAAGTARMQVTRNELSVSGPCSASTTNSPAFVIEEAAVSGRSSALTFNGSSQSSGGGTSTTNNVRFTGSLSAGTITGTLNIDVAQQGSTVTPNASGSGSTTFQVTLQKQPF